MRKQSAPGGNTWALFHFSGHVNCMAGTEYQRLYKSKAWQTLRQATLARDGWKCQRCGVLLISGRASSYAAVVNHKTPHKGDLALFHDPANLEAVCKQCHDSRIQKEERSNRRPIGLDGYPI